MAVTGSPRNYHKRFKFIIEIDSVVSARFQTCSELTAEVATVEQWEGGSLLAEKQPGRITIPDITLERGATNDLDLWNWFRQVADLVRNGGAVLPEHERTLDIVQQERDNSTKIRWRGYRMWPNKFTAGAWDNNSDENLVESVGLVCHYFEPIVR